MENFRCGYVGIVGRPNVGKSTFLNKALGQKVSITSGKPQTTRNRVMGIYNAEGVQAVLVDTPGHHDARSELNRRMVHAAEAALAEVDLVVLMIDLVPATKAAGADKAVLSKGEEVLLERIAAEGHPCILALNKVDIIPRQALLPVIDAWRTKHDFAAVVPFSALTGDGVEPLLAEITRLLPKHPPFFPTDQLMDSSERFVVAEIIREKLFHLLQEELPYSVAVEIEAFDEEERGDDRPFVKINARIIVERSSQKGIVIGRGGQMLKRVGTLARKDIQRLLGCGVYLELFVAVENNWTKNGRLLRQLGYE